MLITEIIHHRHLHTKILLLHLIMYLNFMKITHTVVESNLRGVVVEFSDGEMEPVDDDKIFVIEGDQGAVKNLKIASKVGPHIVGVQEENTSVNEENDNAVIEIATGKSSSASSQDITMFSSQNALDVEPETLWLLKATAARIAVNGATATTSLRGRGGSSAVLEGIKGAYASDSGLMVSVVPEYILTEYDTSGSIMQKMLPQGLAGGFFFPSGKREFQDGSIGVIFPSSPSLPTTTCSYTVDAATFRRESHSGSRCGLHGSYDWEAGGGECPANQTAEEYAEEFYFKPLTYSYGPEKPSWPFRSATCHQTDPMDTLAAQVAFYLLLALNSTEDEWNLYTQMGGPQCTYNEMVLVDKPQIEAFFWAHSGS
ncbi:hypothetical protein ACHAWF_014049, partial [Thalassiosira exigua]